MAENQLADEFRNPVYKSPRKPSKPNASRQALPSEDTDLSKIEHFFEMYSHGGSFNLADIRVFCENFAAFGHTDEESIQSQITSAQTIFTKNDSDNHKALNYDQFVKFAKEFLQ